MKRLRSSYYALAGLLVLVAASSGCTSVNDRLADYQARLSRVPDEQTAPQSVTRVLRRPVQHNRLALPQADVNLLALLRLDDCRIGLTVAQKGSSLGRVALPSQQVLVELELLTHGPAGAAAAVRDDAGAITLSRHDFKQPEAEFFGGFAFALLPVGRPLRLQAGFVFHINQRAGQQA